MTALDFLPTTYSRGPGAVAASATRISEETVVCDACGCRLTTRDTLDDAGFTGSRTYYHFVGAAGHDARGCSVACVDAAHGVG